MKKRISIILLTAMMLSMSSESLFPFFKYFPLLKTPIAQAAATAACALDISPAVAQRSGESFVFTSTISNPGADPGFSPAIELVLPSEITLNSATFSLGSLALSPVTTITVTDNDGGSPTTGLVTNPLTNTTALLPVGNTYRLYRLPLGSFVPGQPPVSIDFDATLSSVPPINIPLTNQIQSRCEFILGSDPLDNPNVDAPIFSAFSTSTITPTLLTATKEMVTTDGEDETATGENFPVTYTIGANVSNSKTITNLLLSESLPSTEHLFEITGQVGGANQIVFTPFSGPVQTYNAPFTFPIAISTAQPGGTLTANFPSITGTTSADDATLTFRIFVPDLNNTLTAILPPNSGGSVNINNVSTAGGTYLGNPVSDTLPTPVVLAARAIATQKGRSIFANSGNAGFTPGDVIQYTINFQVSDYFTENNLVIEDLLPDGMTYVAGSARLSVTEDGSTNSALAFSEATQAEAAVITGPAPYSFAACGTCNLAITPDTLNDNDAITPPGDGRTVMAFDVSSRIALVGGEDDIFEGGLVGPTPVGQPTRGTITYRATINEDFIDSQPNDVSIDADDTLDNSETVSAQVLNPAPTPTGNYTSDTSSASITIVPTTYAKDLYGHLPDGGTLDIKPFVAASPLQIAPNDQAVYKLTVDVPSGDMEKLRIKDFLPIPFFDASEINTTFDTTIYTPADGVPASIPPTGNIAYGSGTTGLPPLTIACPTLSPTITTDLPTNTFQINYNNASCFEKTPSTPIHLELFFTVTAKPKPMANSLKIVNLATFSVDDSANTDVSVDSSIIDILTLEPELNITKGVISTDKAGAVFAPVSTGPVVFAAPGVNPPFTGPFSSTNLAASPIDSNISNVDAGDKIRFAAILENTGGAKAYDVTYNETLPTGFAAPTSVADLNLKVYDAFGNDRTADTDGGLFGFQANGGTSSGGDTSVNLKPGSGFFLPPLTDAAATKEGQANEGANILFITYELKIDQSSAAYSLLTNTGKLTKYASVSGSFNYIDPTDPLKDDATTTLPGLSLQKIPMPAPSGDQSFTTCPNAANCRATIGEPIQYRIPVTLPEGTTTFTLNDNIPAGLGYFFTPGVTLDGSTANCPEATSNFSGTLPSISVVAPVGAGVAASGVDLQATFTNAIVTNNNITTDNTFCIFYQAVLLNPLNNPVNKSNSATLTVGSNTTTAATATIRGRQPILNISKSVTPASGDAGDVVAYTVTISHNGSSNADATDISISDILPTDLDIDLLDAAENFATDGLDNDGDGLTDGADANEVAGNFYNSGTKTFTFNKTTTNNTAFDQLPLASTITLNFKAKLLSTVTPSQVITNTANLVYDSILGVPLTGIQKNGSNNGNTNLSVVTVTGGKTINSTSIASTGTTQHVGANADLTIGEQVTYRITVNVPESTTSNLVVTDNLPSLFRLDSATLISDGTSSAAPVIATIDSNADLINDRATFTFATLNPPAVPTGTPVNRVIELEVVATVLDNPANANSQLKTNNVTVNWTGNTGAAATAAVPADLVEPNLSINKTFIPNTGDAGDIVTFALQTSHSVVSTSSAYNLQITDNVPTSLTILDFGSDGIDNDGDTFVDDINEVLLFTNAVSGQIITLNTATTGNVLFTELPLATNITYQIRAQINNTVFPGQIITNTSNLIYDSAPGANPDQRNYNGTDNDTLTINPLVPSKVVFATDLADTTDAKFNVTNQDLAIGETITYRITAPIPESNASNFVITDTLPNRFQAISGALIQDDGVGHTFAAAALQDNLNADGINDTVVFNFGNLSNPPDLDTEAIVVEVVAKVINNPANVAGTPYTNSAAISYTELGAPILATVSTDVVEPALSIVKTVNPLTGDSGDQFEYTIVISNTGTASAYDIKSIDDPNSLLNINTNFATDGIDNNGDGVDGDANEIAGTFYDGNQFTWNAATTSNSLFTKLDPSQSITFKYQVTLSNGVNPNQIINNTATLDYDSWPLVNPDQRTYNDSDDASITVSNNSALLKTIRDADVEKAIGEIVPYRIRVRVPEGTVDGLIINDTLPAGLAYVPGTAVAYTDNIPEVTWDGVPTTPTELPLSTVIGAGSTQSLTFSFGNVVNSNVDNLTDEHVFIEYDAVVMNTSDNNDADTKQNTVTATIGTTGGNLGPASAPLITVIEPFITIDKTSSYTIGSVVTYQLKLINDATSPNAVAHDIVITDILPPGMTYLGNLNLLNGPALPSVNSTGAPNIVFTYPTLDPSNNTGNPIIFTYQAQINSGVVPTTILTNNVSLIGSSIAGQPGQIITGNPLSSERTGLITDPGGAENDYTDTDNFDITVTRPDLSTSFKSVTDLNGGTIEANDTLLYHLEIINTGNSNASAIHVLDNLPSNVHNFIITTLPLSGTNNSLPAPAGINSTGVLDFTNIILGPTGSPTDREIIEFTVQVDIGLPDGTNIVNNFLVDPATEGGPGGGGTVSTASTFPIISLSKTVLGPTALEVGQETTYQVTVSNNGSSASTNATLVDPLPAQMEYIPGSLVFENVAQTDALDLDFANFNASNPNAITFIIPNLAVGQTQVMKYKAKSKAGTEGQSATNTITLDDDQGSHMVASANISVLLPPPTSGAGGGFGGGGGSGGGGSPSNSLFSVFEAEETNQREVSCDAEVSQPEIVPTACLQLVPNRELSFTDLSDSDQSYAPFINTLKNTQIIRNGDFVFSGNANHSTGKQQSKFQSGTWEFQPNRQVTRLEAVKTALVSNCIPVDDQIIKPSNGFEFTDLPAHSEASEVDDFATRVFYTAYRHGVIQGDVGRAKPYENISTPELLAISLRAAKAMPTSYDNVPGPWYAKYEKFARDNGLLNKTTIQDINSQMLRKDLAKILVRVMAYNPDPNIYGYIERVDINNQKFDWKSPVLAPLPASGDDTQTAKSCPVEKPVSCLEHDPKRKLIFDDVPKNDWARSYVDILRTTKIVDEGDYIASGHGNQSTGRQQAIYKTGDWLYEPDRYTSRLEITKVALVANCITVEDLVPIPANGFRFSDLPVDVDKSDDLNNFAARVFYTAYKHGIITGKNLTDARPFDPVTRVEAMTILTRASKDTAKYSKPIELPFLDTANGAWYGRLLSYAWENGLVGGEGEKLFQADRKVKRNEMAKLVYSFMLFNDNQGIRDYAQSLKDYYDLPDFEITPGKIIPTFSPINTPSTESLPSNNAEPIRKIEPANTTTTDSPDTNGSTTNRPKTPSSNSTSENPAPTSDQNPVGETVSISPERPLVTTKVGMSKSVRKKFTHN